MSAIAQQPEVKQENAEALKAEIKERCLDTMGGYGDSMVLECMKQDWAAVKRVAEHREDHPGITARCLRSMRDYGFSMVLECIKQDVEASEQIDDW